MPLTLVTGASGFLGWHVARLLSERGHRVRALCRPNSRVRELEVERVPGDLRDGESLARAIAGCKLVFHVAADYRLWSKHPEDLYQSNVEGTRNLLEAAERAGVECVVYTSTVGCIGMPKNALGDEDTPVSVADMAGHYKRSKWLAEQVALEKARAGLPVVIVNPTAPVGDHDWKPTPTGKIIVDFLRNKLPAFVDTGLNLVDVRDIAIGHLLAAEHGRPGERYILGSENLTLQQILGRLAEIANKPAPTTRVPYALAYATGVITTAWADFTGREPLAPLEGVKMARKKMFVTHTKAARELGFSPGLANAALQRAVEWFRANGYC
ncbi:MAG: NAD-dependent epimerase/dehydratase family protein [Acidobacteriaceae bacterium]|nr:NAD-dependent epimerase/dehydratase family protein [Acidobacteriaceae bacterium]MBV9779178.1 NAD-dependent epimerase/dehydratase family protein [Acidobacteriaceae bacterium]